MATILGALNAIKHQLPTESIQFAQTQSKLGAGALAKWLAIQEDFGRQERGTRAARELMMSCLQERQHLDEVLLHARFSESAREQKEQLVAMQLAQIQYQSAFASLPPWVDSNSQAVLTKVLGDSLHASPSAEFLRDIFDRRNSVGAALAISSSIEAAEARRWGERLDADRRQFAAMTALARSTTFIAQDIQSWLTDAHDGLIPVSNEELRLAYRYAALSRASSRVINAFAARPESLGSLPTAIRSLPLVATNLGAHAVLGALTRYENRDRAEFSSDLDLAEKSNAVSRTDREKFLAALDPLIPETLHAARATLSRRGLDYTSQACISIRRAIGFGLEAAAPAKAVSEWKDSRCRMRDDGKGPTLSSRFAYALRDLPHSSSIGLMASADALVGEALMRLINGPAHLDRASIPPLELELLIERAELLLFSIACAARYRGE